MEDFSNAFEYILFGNSCCVRNPTDNFPVDLMVATHYTNIMKKRNRKNPKRNGVQVRLTDKVFARLQADAKSEDVSLAEILRRAYEKSNLES